MNYEICEEILVQLRKIVRSMSIHSRSLKRDYALTGPQLVLLREIMRSDSIAIGTLAERVSLSNATVTGIIDRLEQCGFVTRSRNGCDRRQVFIGCTDEGRKVAEKSPPLFQEDFITALSNLKDWEQSQILSAVSRLAVMMGGAPKLDTEPPAGTPALTESDGFIASCQMLLDSEPGDAEADRDADGGLRIVTVCKDDDFPAHVDRDSLSLFLNEYLRPYEDTREDILAGLAYVLDQQTNRGGFVLLAMQGETLTGALVMLSTGMKGYVPEHLLLFVAVSSDMRGKGIGAKLIQRAQQLCIGDIKLHVDYDNPAKRLYERMGFSSKYAEMRWVNESRNDKS